MDDNRKKDEGRREGLQIDLPEDERKGERRGRERRTKERIGVKMWIRNIDGDASYFHQTGNLSASGMYILAPSPQKQGNVIDLEFQVPGTKHLITCPAEIVASKNDGEFYGLSVRFLQMQAQDRKMIESAMNDLISEFWFLTE
ncbi:PilZ domain-containing protein [bacterium]|nr:PilZ domain-containing protein [bacterium]